MTAAKPTVEPGDSMRWLLLLSHAAAARKWRAALAGTPNEEEGGSVSDACPMIAPSSLSPGTPSEDTE